MSLFLSLPLCLSLSLSLSLAIAPLFLEIVEEFITSDGGVAVLMAGGATEAAASGLNVEVMAEARLADDDDVKDWWAPLAALVEDYQTRETQNVEEDVENIFSSLDAAGLEEFGGQIAEELDGAAGTADAAYVAVILPHVWVACVLTLFFVLLLVCVAKSAPSRVRKGHTKGSRMRC